MNTPPRIAILASYPVWLLENSPVPATSGHYATWLVALSHFFESRRDFDIHWVTLSKAVTTPQHLDRLGQHFHILPRASKTLGLYSFYLHDRHSVARELKRLNPDLVHAWGNEDCYGLCSTDFRGKKLISTQGMLRAIAARGELSSFLRIQGFLYEKRVYRAHRWITAESPWSAARVKELAPQANPFPLEYAPERRFMSVTRHPAPIPICLFAGSDVPLKNVDLLVEAFSRPELAHVQLNLAGVSPASRPNLPNNIHALGRVSRDEMARLLSEAWCLVHPSLADASPNTVKEARVIGLPAVISEECGNKHYYVEGKSGFICGVHDVDAFVRGILAVTKDVDTSLSMGRYGLEECRHALSEEVMYESLRDIYDTILRA